MDVVVGLVPRGRRRGRVPALRRRPLIRVALAFVALVLAGGCASNASSPDREIEIGIHHSEFRPDRVRVEAGTTVTFVVDNSDPIDHELIIGNEEVQEIHEEGTEAHHGAKPGEISVPAGTTRTTTYTFTEPGDLIYGCHLPGHYDYGMRGTIEIR